MTGLLQVEGLFHSFGGIAVAEDIGFTLSRGDRLAIIGANGAGKTTLVNMITGHIRAKTGRIRLDGRDITRLSITGRVRCGIARSFQTSQLFMNSTVLENLLLPAGLSAKSASFAARMTSPLSTPDTLAKAKATAERFGLGDRLSVRAGELAQGERKLLDVAMATALSPTVLLLDEPTSGVGEEEKQALMEPIVSVATEDRLAVLFVEHDMDIVRYHATSVLALYQGRVIASGTVDDVLAHPDVRTYVTGEQSVMAGGASDA